MIKSFFLTLIFIIVFCDNTVVYGTEAIINETLDYYKFDEINSVLSNESGLGLSFESLVRNIIVGEVGFSLEEIFNYIIEIFKEQYRRIISIFFDLFILGVSSAFIQNLTNSVKPKSTASMGNYVCYIVLIHMLATSLIDIMLISTTFFKFIEDFTLAAIPILMGTLAFSGYLGTLYFVQPVIVTLTYIISYIFKSLIVQFIFIIAIIEIINGVTSKELLNNFCEAGNKIIKLSLGGISLIYMMILSIVKIGGPISDNIVKKGAKAVVGALPVVGNTLKSAVDTVAMVAEATSGALIFALVICIVLYSLSYFVPLLTYSIVFTISYIVIEPIAEKNIVNAIKSTTKYIGYLMSIFGVSVMLLVFTVIVVLS